MSSLGRFSAGLMHDILNPLNYTRTGAFTLRKKTRQLPPELRTEIDAILTDMEDGLKRVDNIVSDLRTFTHPGGQARELTNLADVLNISLRFVSAELKDKNIAVNLDVPPGQTAWISRNHLILVLVNLLENAIDALELKPFAGDDRPTVTIASRVENGRSLISIRDNGPGIAPEHLAKIFDPFYTTKDVGKGTGLGLSICFGIVRGCGGSISAVSEPGKFCEFILDLPSTFVSETDATTPLQHADQPIRL
jgi:two-component system sensor histidine kinase PhcS